MAHKHTSNNFTMTLSYTIIEDYTFQLMFLLFNFSKSSLYVCVCTHKNEDIKI